MLDPTAPSHWREGLAQACVEDFLKATDPAQRITMDDIPEAGVVTIWNLEGTDGGKSGITVNGRGDHRRSLPQWIRTHPVGHWSPPCAGRDSAAVACNRCGYQGLPYRRARSKAPPPHPALWAAPASVVVNSGRQQRGRESWPCRSRRCRDSSNARLAARGVGLGRGAVLRELPRRPLRHAHVHDVSCQLTTVTASTSGR
jgi:hypothetical protein